MAEHGVGIGGQGQTNPGVGGSSDEDMNEDVDLEASGMDGGA